MSSALSLRRVFILAAVAVGLGTTHDAAYGTNTQIPGKLLIVKSGKFTKFVSKPISPASFPTPTAGGSADPTRVDGSFSVVDEVDNTRTFFANLPKAKVAGPRQPRRQQGLQVQG